MDKYPAKPPGSMERRPDEAPDVTPDRSDIPPSTPEQPDDTDPIDRWDALKGLARCVNERRLS